MKRLFCLLLAFCVMMPSALAESTSEAAPLTREQFYPEGANAQNASYAFRYAYPQLAADTPQAKTVNAYYQSLAVDMVDTVMPETIASLDALPSEGTPAYYTQLDYTLTANTADFLSVLLTSRQFLGNAETERWTANVFAMSGVYAGQTVSLSQAMGLEQEDDAADADNSYASELVYGLVWQIISTEQAMQQKDYDPTLTLTDLERVFSPESDFYIDADGNFVFYIQAGDIASEVEGVLTYPFSAAELLSAVKP